MHINECGDLVGGVTLAGWQQADGSIIAHVGGRVISQWPDNVTIPTIGTFNLESVEFVGGEGDPRGRFMNAEYC